MVPLVWIMMQKSCKSYWSPKYILNGTIIEKHLFSFSLCWDFISTLEKCASHHYLIIQNSEIQLYIWRSSWRKRKLTKLRVSSFCCFNFIHKLQILDILHVCHISRVHSTQLDNSKRNVRTWCHLRINLYIISVSKYITYLYLMNQLTWNNS